MPGIGMYCAMTHIDFLKVSTCTVFHHAHPSEVYACSLTCWMSPTMFLASTLTLASALTCYSRSPLCLIMLTLARFFDLLEASTAFHHADPSLMHAVF